MATNVTDLTEAYRAIAGDDPSDPWSQPESVDAVPPGVDPMNLRLGVVKQWMSPSHSREVSRGIEAFLASAVSVGVDIVDVDEPGLAEESRAAAAFAPEVAAIHAERFAEDPDRYGPETRLRLQEISNVAAETLVDAMVWRSQARAIIGRLFNSDVDALIAPTVGGMRKVIGESNMDLDGEQIFHRTLLASFTAPINQIGAPAIAAPIRPSNSPSDVPPVSVQLVGPLWGESELLGIATVLESAGVLGVIRPPTFFDQ